MNSAIIVAAGSGKRFGRKTPKQFLEIHGKPVLIHTLERFEKCDSIDEIILVLSENKIKEFSVILGDYNLPKLRKIIKGGENRAESVYKGLNEIKPESAEIIAVHDGARPLVTSEEISQTIEKAKEFGAACLVAEVTDTIKEVSENKIIKTVSRQSLRKALTPQCFRYNILTKAFDENDISAIATDECYLVEQLGYEIVVVEGSSRNIKITFEEDLKIAEALL